MFNSNPLVPGSGLNVHELAGGHTLAKKVIMIRILHFNRISQTMISDKFPSLYQFFGAYFHQDWYIDDHNAESVVYQYVKAEPEIMVKQTINEIMQLLNLQLSESEMQNLLVDELGCYYDPTFYGLSYKEWLNWLQVILKTAREEIYVLV